VAYSGAVGRPHQLDRSFGQAGFAQAGAQAVGDHAL
jgi:hypothetical protein